MSDAAGKQTTVVLGKEAMATALQSIARAIAEDNPEIEEVVLLGILRRGRPLADRLATLLESMTGHRPQVGSLATTLYRDDLRTGAKPASTGQVTHFDFDVDGAHVILVDDVLSTGRTVRAALDEIIDYGRPRFIRLACLVDRGLRELPIKADYLGWTLATEHDDHVLVKLNEIDGEDAVLLTSAGDKESGT